METIARKRRITARHNEGSIFVDGIRHDIERTVFSDGFTRLQVVRDNRIATETGSMVAVRMVVANGAEGVRRWVADHTRALDLIGRETGRHSSEYVRTRVRATGGTVRRVSGGEVVRSVPVVLPHMIGRHRREN